MKSMKKVLLMLFVFLIISSNVFAIVVLTKGNPNDYTDISAHWAYESIKNVISKGYFKGVTSTQFMPDEKLTRAMAVTAIWRLTGDELTHTTTKDGVTKVIPNYVNKFWDMKDSAWYTNYISWANKNKIIKGYSEREFRPDETVSREQLAVILYNYFKEYRVIRSFDPYTVNEEITFTDDSLISDWAKKEVTVMQRMGLMSGREDGSFDPKGTVTRAEMAVIIDRIVNLFF